MLKSSVTFAVLSYLWNAILTSKLHGFLSKILLVLADSYRESMLHRILSAIGNFDDYIEGSVFYRILLAICGFFVRIVSSIASFAVKLGEGSVVLRVWRYCTSSSFLLDRKSVFALGIMGIFLIPHNYWNNVYSLAIALLLCVIYVFCLEKGRPFGADGKRIPFEMLLFFFALCVSMIHSYDRADSIRILVFFIASYLLCFLVYGCLCDKESLERFMFLLYATLLIMSAVGIVQRILGVEANASLTDLELNQGMPGRVFGTLDNPNNYAEYLMLFMPYGFSYALTRKETAQRKLFLIGMLLPLAAILLTYSRSGWIALFAAAVVYALLMNYRYLSRMAILGLCAIPLLPRSIFNRILTIGNTSDSSSSYRIKIWTGVLDMMKTYWFHGLGLGPGAFAIIFPKYAIGDTSVAMHSHMQFLEMLVENGILGFISYILLVFCTIKRPCVYSRRTSDPLLRAYCIAAAASLTGFTLIGLFEYCWFYPRVMMAYFVSVGISLAVCRLVRKSNG